ncbi:hypothetical protein [Algoriphagus sediminis]|uniref:Uncharacterized protein n=1 Tax=Algoriphagus sediminis TaxID=3057113 RepID=A0ABT7YG79_9BACT|nr:hypothetical protein [Algoriphagus sediminis]MDN3205350.1 hypothetical protein [Algoriphagus sediminis]
MKSKIGTVLLILANLLIIIGSIFALTNTSPLPNINLGGFIVFTFSFTLILVLLSVFFKFLDKSPEDPKRAIKIYLTTGLVFLVFGSGPLLVTILMANLGLTSDPNPNPIFFGMMAGFSFWPGILFLLTAIIKKYKLRKMSTEIEGLTENQS